MNRWGYLHASQWKSGIITWSRGEGINKTIAGRISITVNTNSESGYLELDYKHNDKPIKYRVQLVTIPANIGKGRVWFFICPQTGKHCRKLYLAGGYFFHRTAFTGGMYKKQADSKRWREWDKIFSGETITEQLTKPYFKTHYNGKPTKRYLKIQQIEQEIISETKIIELLKM